MLGAAAGMLAGDRGVALVFGPVVGLVIALTVTRQVLRMPEPGYANLRIRGRGRDLVRNLILGLAGLLSLITGLLLVVLLAVGVPKGLAAALTVLRNIAPTLLVWTALPLGLAVGLVRWVRSPASDDRSRTPASAYRQSRNLTVLVGLAFGLGFGPLIWLTVVAAFHASFPLATGLTFALIPAAACIVGLAVAPANESAWFGFTMTAQWLTIRGRLPWKTMEFLDDAHRLGLLRTAGMVYQFRHAELQDHLAK